MPGSVASYQARAFPRYPLTALLAADTDMRRVVSAAAASRAQCGLVIGQQAQAAAFDWAAFWAQAEAQGFGKSKNRRRSYFFFFLPVFFLAFFFAFFLVAI